MICKDLSVNRALGARQRGFLLNPFRFGSGPATDPNFSSVQLLAHMNGANGGTAFVDSSAAGRALTAQSSAVTTTGQSVYGGASGDFTANNDSRVETASASTLRIIGSCCLEFWFRMTSVASGIYFAAVTADTNVWVYTNATGKLGVYFLGAQLDNLATITTGVWYHFAVTRDPTNSVRAFLAGTLVATSGGPVTANMSTNASVRVGAAPSLAGSGSGGRCYIDDFRLTIGAPRYTASFTPPAAEFPNS